MQLIIRKSNYLQMHLQNLNFLKNLIKSYSKKLIHKNFNIFQKKFKKTIK